MDAKHTPGSVWVHEGDVLIKDPGFATTCVVARCRVPETALGVRIDPLDYKANAAFIALAWNCHDDLLAACQAAIEATGGSKHWNGETEKFLKLCEAAIEKATQQKVTQ